MPTVLELYEKLKPKLGDEEARALLEFVETSVEHRAATKEDLQRETSVLKADLQRERSALRADLERETSALREHLQRETSALRADLQQETSTLRQEIQNVKVELIKWSFGFWIGSIAVLSGIMLAMLRAFVA